MQKSRRTSSGNLAFRNNLGYLQFNHMYTAQGKDFHTIFKSYRDVFCALRFLVADSNQRKRQLSSYTFFIIIPYKPKTFAATDFLLYLSP